jgi:hypothetical protein
MRHLVSADSVWVWGTWQRLLASPEQDLCRPGPGRDDANRGHFHQPQRPTVYGIGNHLQKISDLTPIDRPYPTPTNRALAPGQRARRAAAALAAC